MPSFSGARWDREADARKRRRQQEIAEANAPEMPVLAEGDEVLLRADKTRRRYHAVVTWRSRHEMGFRFTDPRWTGAPTERLYFTEIPARVTKL